MKVLRNGRSQETRNASLDTHLEFEKITSHTVTVLASHFRCSLSVLSFIFMSFKGVF